MSLDDLDQRLFGWLHQRLRRLVIHEIAASSEAVEFAAISSRLALLASALSGTAFEVRRAEHVGGVRGAVLLLPAVVDRHDSRAANLDVYLYRVAYGVQSRALGFSTTGLPPERVALASLLAATATRRALAHELPACSALLERVRTPRPSQTSTTATSEAREVVASLLFADQAPASGPSWLREHFHSPPGDQPSLIARCMEIVAAWPALALALEQAAAEHAIVFGRLLSAPTRPASVDAPGSAGGTPPAPGGTERRAPARDEVELVESSELVREPDEENPLIHSFEQVQTLDDHQGGSRRMDGDDQLDDQLDALEELDLRRTIRTRETSNSVYRAEGLFEAGAGELREDEHSDDARPHRCYDEWDSRKQCYRPDWCTLYLERPPAAADSARVATRMRRVQSVHARQLRELKAALEALELERRWRTRQLDGPEFDLDALVVRQSAVAAGYAGDERIHAIRRRHERDVATLIVLDLSLSSDSFVEDRRILDVAQDALIVLGEVLDQAQDQFAVAGFFSHTRRDCRWLALKPFDMNWSESLPRLLGVKPTGYTRIGPALRHGVQTLVTHPARRRLLLLVTDGRPSDYDQYEGRHGIEDVRKAFEEAEQEGVHPFAITIATQPTPAHARMFGSGRFEALGSPDLLARALAQVYVRLAR